jgi:hypothetical protein
VTKFAIAYVLSYTPSNIEGVVAQELQTIPVSYFLFSSESRITPYLNDNKRGDLITPKNQKARKH